MTADTPEALSISTDDRGVATVTLARPEVHNAFDDALIARLTETFRRLGADDTVRVVVLAAEGRSFSAGADLTWMKRIAGYSRAENLTDARALADMLDTIDRCPKPTLAVVQGTAMAGGVGLIAACDIAIASARATFALSEVRLGLIPATIGPYVVTAMGPRACRRYFLTGERFDAETALRLGLIHDLVSPEDLEPAARRLTETLLAAGPQAQQAAKALIRTVAFRTPDPALRDDMAARIADIRASTEGREGIAAFLDKRPPAWSDGPGIGEGETDGCSTRS